MDVLLKQTQDIMYNWNLYYWVTRNRYTCVPFTRGDATPYDWQGGGGTKSEICREALFLMRV